MSIVNTAKLKEFLYQRDCTAEFPALYDQINSWNKLRPLENISVLDSTPVFFNTGLKYLALLSAGAKLTVSTPEALPKDENAVSFFRECGIDIITDNSATYQFDCICDCAGMHKTFLSKYGVVELTGSGVHAYRNWHAPVFLADGGKVKILEVKFSTNNF